jgi:hypothetical protein
VWGNKVKGEEKPAADPPAHEPLDHSKAGIFGDGRDWWRNHWEFAVASTENPDLLEQLVALFHDKVRPSSKQSS